MPPGDLPDFLARELDCSKTLFRNPARRFHRRRYYRIARASKVDESLFGPSHREVHPDNKECFPQIQKEADEWKKQRVKEWDKTAEKTQRIVTKDLIRYMKHPECRFAEDVSVILGPLDYNRIVQESHVITPKMRQEASEKTLQDKAEKMKEVADRKQAVKIMDLQRRKNERLNDLEEEEKVKADVLLKKANEMRLEQEDEIKYLNELIMNAKCQVVRDHQLKEKAEIKQDLKDEDKRLDLESERDRINAIRIQEEIERRRREERLIGAMKIMEQIKENEQERLLDLERKDQENQMMLRYLDKLCEEEAALRERQRLDKIRLREELNQCNEDMLKRKELDAEQDKMIDESVLQFQTDKAEREAAFEREQERIRREKEAETARLRALQERASDEKAIRDGLRAKRAAEQAERNWRKKEAMEEVMRVETEQMLKKSRLKQIEQKAHYMGIQAQREKADFQRVLRAQQELIEKENRDLDVFKKRQKAFREGITTQIREKEQVKIGERIAFFEEGVKIQREARQRRLKLEQVKDKKLRELRHLGLPEKYLARVENKSQKSLKPRIGNAL